MKRYIKSSTESMNIWQLYSENNVGYKSAIRKAYRDGEISKEQMDSAISEIDNTIYTILDNIIDNFTDVQINALRNTMNRNYEMTSDFDIAGHAELYKTANGFVLECPATRSKFRVFIDDNGNLRRMPSNEMSTASIIELNNKHRWYLNDKFREVYNN